MYPSVLVVGRWVIEVLVDDLCRQVAGPFAGVGDDGFEVDLEVEKADCWGDGLAVLGEFVAPDCQANAVCFSLGEIDVAEKFGMGYFFVFGDALFGDKEDGIGPVNLFGAETGFTPTLR